MTTEKIDLHYYQQLSALMDGELAPDEARFLLRRLQHDAELTACWERWQLCGDALRGQAQAAAPAGFAEGIARAVAAEPALPAPDARGPRFARWGGGALAASVAALALFMGRGQMPEDVPPAPAGTIASQAPAPRIETPAAEQGAAAIESAAALAAAGAAAASAPLRQPGSGRAPIGSATRTQQAARAASAARAPERSAPERAVASAGAAASSPAPAAAVPAAAVPVIHAIATAPADVGRANPFGDVQVEPRPARPWPRAVLPQYAPGGGSFNADFSVGSSPGSVRDFYPFEPRLLSPPPVALPQSPPAD